MKKKGAEVEAKVEQARGALASAEKNRDANEKALAEARSHSHKTEQEHVARFPSGCPLDNRISSGQCAKPAAAAGNKDASGDVAMGEVDGVDIELTSRTLTKKPKTSGNNRCNNFEVTWELRRPSAEKSTWQALRMPPQRQPSCTQLRQRPPRRLQGRRAYHQSASDEEILCSEQEPSCI